MKLSNSFAIARSPAEVFEAFLDIERVATCMPGSRLLGSPSEGTYEGEVKVKVGPLGVAYSGELQLLEVDRDELRITMRAKGREQRGAGNADAYVVAQLSDHAGGTLVDIGTELNVRGKVAQFGRGIIGEVTDSIMQTFARNVEQLLTQGTPTPSAAGTSSPTVGAPGSSSTSAGAPSSTEGVPASPDAGFAAGADGEGLDAWRLILRPMLRRHGSAIAGVAFSGLAAYIGARAGARRERRITNRRECTCRTP